MTKIVNVNNLQEEKGKSRTLSEEAYIKIKRLIFNQKLVPGQRLVYQELGKILDMSQTPIINALNRLDQEGFVAYENYRGFIIKPLENDEIWNNFGFREAVEVYTVKQAIQFGSPESITLLEVKLYEHKKHNPGSNTREGFLLNSRFHIQIAEMTRNPILKFVLKRNFEHIYLRANFDRFHPEVMGSFFEDHRQLVERMKKKDTLGAIDIIENHIRKARDYVIKGLSAEEFKGEKPR